MNTEVMKQYLQDWNEGNLDDLRFDFEFKRGILDVVDTIRLPIRYAMEYKDFLNRIAFVACFLCGNEFLVANLSYNRVMCSIRQYMEDEMSKGEHTFANLLAATIGAWAGCEYFDLGIPLEDIKEQAIEAAWTDKNQQMMREQWELMEPVMRQYRGHI